MFARHRRWRHSHWVATIINVFATAIRELPYRCGSQVRSGLPTDLGCASMCRLIVSGFSCCAISSVSCFLYVFNLLWVCFAEVGETIRYWKVVPDKVPIFFQTFVTPVIPWASSSPKSIIDLCQTSGLGRDAPYWVCLLAAYYVDDESSSLFFVKLAEFCDAFLRSCYSFFV